MITFWDIDGTLIDSDARFNAACVAGNGTFNVDYYRARQTDKDLAADTELPLLRFALNNINREYILTARDMTKADFKQLETFGLNAKAIFHRGNAPSYIAKLQNNGEYKKAYIEYLRLIKFNNVKSDNSGNWAIIYDDDKGVLNIAKEVGLYAHDAIKLNNILKVAV